MTYANLPEPAMVVLAGAAVRASPLGQRSDSVRQRSSSDALAGSGW